MKRILTLILSIASLFAVAQNIGNFQSVEPHPQDQNFHIPSTHAFQLIVQADDSLSEGGIKPGNSDFTGFISADGVSNHGVLGVNSEFVPGGVSFFDLKLDSTAGLWDVTSGKNVDFSLWDCTFITNLGGTLANCSGGISPWRTYFTCEENTGVIDAGGTVIAAPCTTAEGYNNFGWIIELDPITKEVKDHNNDGSPDKLWALGRMKHENICFRPDSLTVYFGEDNAATGYAYKFVANQKMDLSSGTLYVMVTPTPWNGTAQWVQVPNTTVADRNGTVPLATALGAFNFDRIEDVEVGPDGKIYIASTGGDRVYRFSDNGTSITNLETFVDNQTYTITHDGTTTDVPFTYPDNLAFDHDGNLWVNQNGGDNLLWVVGPTHTTANPDIRVFASTPSGCETTGTTFSPDGKYIFMSIQHPSTSNATPQMDAADRNVIFNKDATVVIARKEVLGNLVSSVAGGLSDFKTLELYPNPATSILNLKISSPVFDKAVMTIFNIKGQLVKTVNYSLHYGINALQVNIGELAKGNYVLKLQHRDRVLTEKFTKQ